MIRKPVLVVALLVFVMPACSDAAAEPRALRGVSLPDEPVGPDSSSTIDLTADTVRLGNPKYAVGGPEAPESAAFARISGGAIDARKRLWVSDEWVGRVARIEPDGRTSISRGLRPDGSCPSKSSRTEVYPVACPALTAS